MLHRSKTIDDQEHTFDAAVLRTMKDVHKRKVARALALAGALLDNEDVADPKERWRHIGNVEHTGNMGRGDVANDDNNTRG